MSFSIKLGNFLYNYAFVLYKPMYIGFKNKQDAFEIELLKKYIPVNATVLDIGANIGFYATILSKIVGQNGKVYCFEPDTTNFNHLKKTTLGLINITIENKAVGPKTEKLKIYTSKNLNVDHRTYKPDDYDAEFEIDAISIDDYFDSAALKNKRIDFIKMDIQGFEMQAMQGMQRTLEANPNIQLISEFWPYGLRKAGSSLNLYYDFLIGKGFTCYLLEKNSLLKLNPDKVHTLQDLGEEHYFNIFATQYAI